MQNLNFDGTSLKLRSTIAAMSEIAKLAPNIFESKHKIIIKDFVVKELLITDRVSSIGHSFGVHSCHSCLKNLGRLHLEYAMDYFLLHLQYKILCIAKGYNL